ncbi:MAG: hypothetical protein LW832_00945 [Parachlamydia sp.]|nr:hypothetical protein [Parachlamydia sp.]
MANPTNHPLVRHPILPYPPEEQILVTPRLSFSSAIQTYAEGLQKSARTFKASVLRWLTNLLVRIEHAFLKIVYQPKINFNSFEFREKIHEITQEKPIMRGRIQALSDVDINQLNIRRVLKEVSELKISLKQNIFNLEFFIAEMASWQEDYDGFFSEMKLLNEEYQLLSADLDLIVNSKKTDCCTLFEGYSSQLTQAAIPMPAPLRQELMEDWEHFKEAILPSLNVTKALNLQRSMYDFEKEFIESEGGLSPLQGAARPLALKNVGNSCYLDSAFHLLFCTKEAEGRILQDRLDSTISNLEEQLAMPTLSEQQKAPLRTQLHDKKTSADQRKKIQHEIAKLLKPSPTNTQKPGLLDYVLSMTHTLTLKELRQLIFDSRLHADLQVGNGFRESISSQRDAAAVVEFIMENILEIPFHAQRFFKTSDIPGVLFPSNKETNYTLSCQLQRASNLQDVIQNYFANEVHINDLRNQVLLDPRDAIVEPGVEIADGNVRQFANYETWFELQSLPELLAVHIKRFNSNLTKNDNLVHLPSEGVDLAPCFRNREPQGQTKYEVVGYVVHQGSYLGGHYVAYVKKEGKYWFCNDSGPTTKEISAEEFFSHKKAYLIMLKPKEAPPEEA